MNKDISKFKRKLKLLKYYLLFYIAVVFLVVFIDIEFFISKSSEYRISDIRVALSFLSIFILPFLAIFNCFIYRYNFWRCQLEFLLCSAVLVSTECGLIGLFPGLTEIYSFGEFLWLLLIVLRYIWPYLIPVSIISAIIVWLIIRMVAKIKGLINYNE